MVQTICSPCIFALYSMRLLSRNKFGTGCSAAHTTRLALRNDSFFPLQRIQVLLNKRDAFGVNDGGADEGHLMGLHLV